VYFHVFSSSTQSCIGLKNISKLRVISQQSYLSYKVLFCWVIVVHTCNPSYLGGKQQETNNSKPTQRYHSAESYDVCWVFALIDFFVDCALQRLVQPIMQGNKDLSHILWNLKDRASIRIKLCDSLDPLHHAASLHNAALRKAAPILLTGWV
jgi:hypothetical protein